MKKWNVKHLKSVAPFSSWVWDRVVALMKDSLLPLFIVLEGPEAVPYGSLERGGFRTQTEELQTGTL